MFKLKSFGICILSILALTSFAKGFSEDGDGSFDKPQTTFYAVNDEHKFIWFRVHKVGTTTIKQLLKKNEISFSLFNHHPEQFDLTDYANYFKFAFVRNPWDRIVSCYSDRILNKNTAKHSNLKECFDKDFEYFVDYIDRQDLTTANRHIRLQTSLIPVNEIDFVGRIENFAADLAYVFKTVGIRDKEVRQQQLPKRNATDHKHYSQYYNERTKEIIARKYKEDIEAFGYEFEYE